MSETDDRSVCSLGVKDSQLETSSFMFSVYFSIWYTFGKSSAYCHYFSAFWKGQSLLSFWPLVWTEHPNINPHSQVTWKTDDLTVMKIINKKPTVISGIMFSYRPKQCKLDNHLIYMFMYSHPVSGNWKVSFDQTVNNFEAILSPVFLSLCLCFDWLPCSWCYGGEWQIGNWCYVVYFKVI